MEVNDHSSGKVHNPPSIILTIFIAIVLVFVPGFLVSACFGFYAGVNGIEDMGNWFTRIEVQMAIMLFSLPISAILVLVLTNASMINQATQVNKLRAIFQFLHIRSSNIHDISRWIFISSIVWLGIVALGILLDLPEEPFMLMVRDSDTSPLLIIAVVCILAPIVEEMIFRGLLFKRFQLTRLATSGAVIMTCMLFTLIHAQQYTLGGLFVIFLIAAYLTFVRVKTQNTSLAIVAHATNNVLSTIALYHWM